MLKFIVPFGLFLLLAVFLMVGSFGILVCSFAADRQARTRVLAAEPSGCGLPGLVQGAARQPWVLNVWVPGAAVAGRSTTR